MSSYAVVVKPLIIIIYNTPVSTVSYNTSGVLLLFYFFSSDIIASTKYDLHNFWGTRIVRTRRSNLHTARVPFVGNLLKKQNSNRYI